MKQFKSNPLASVAAGLAIFLSALGCSFNAAAQAGPGVIVNDPISIEKAIAEYAEQAARWGKTLAQFQAQLAAYRQMVSTITGFSFQNLLPTKPLQKMDAQQMVAQACPGSGNMAADIFSAATNINLGGNVVETAQRLCAVTTTIKVTMYNDTVDQANRLPTHNSQLTRINDLMGTLFGSKSSVGDAQRLQLESQKQTQQFQQEMQAYATNMQAYQAMLTTLKDSQSTLAQISLKGKPSTLGTITQAGAFAAAFH